MHPEWPRVFTLAADIRSAGEALVASVRSGDIDLARAHAQADADVNTGRVFAVKVYEAVPGIGKVKARRELEALGIDEGAALGDLSAEDRQAIIDRFAEIDGVPLSDLY